MSGPGFRDSHPILTEVASAGVAATRAAHEWGKQPGPLFSRRTLLAGAALTFLEGRYELLEGALGLLHEDDEKAKPPGSETDVLVDPAKFNRFVVRFQHTALELSKNPEQPIPYEVFLAVAMHESDRGRSELAENANNFLGIVAKDGWTGDIYQKRTEEQVPTDEIESYKVEHPDLVVLYDNSDGSSRVEYERPFRKYDTPEECFRDFANKIYYVETSGENEGKYRYADVVDYLTQGGRDPYKVAYYLSDKDSDDELTYGTGSEWRDGVYRYITLVQKQVGKKSSNEPAPDNTGEATFPDRQIQIDTESIDFSEFSTEQEQAVAAQMREAFEKVSADAYRKFAEYGIEDASDRALSLLENDGEYYSRVYRGAINPEYLVLHLWANGVTPGGVDGTSHLATLSDQVESWGGNSSLPSCGYLLSDNEPPDLWRITREEFGATNHVGYGIQDVGATTHPNVGNENAIGIEVQADTIFDVSSSQFEETLYWCAKMLLDSGIVSEGMDRETVNIAVDHAVIGHGKNNGMEFGYKYTRPIVAALQQFMYLAVQA